MNKNGNPELKLVAALAKHLLSPSRIERASALSAAAAAQAAQDSLRCMLALDKPTKLSLPIAQPAAASPTPSPAPAPARASVTGPAAAATVPPPPAPSSPPPVSYGTQKQEYQAALGNSSVIEALLDFHQRARNPQSAHAPVSGFRVEQAPRIQAQPKPKPVARALTRIFRPLGPSGSFGPGTKK